MTQSVVKIFRVSDKQ